MKTIGMVLALLSPVALAEFVPTEPVTNQDGTVACAMNAASIETEQTQDGPVVIFTFVCLNRISKDMGSEKVMVFCESGEVVGLSAAAIGSDGEPRPVPPTERKGIVVGSPLHKMANKVCGYAYARATQGAGYARGLGRN